MMWLWFILLALGAALIPALWPSRTVDRVEADPLQLYKDQLGELESDLAAGRLDKDSAATARLEIERRILRAGKQAESIVHLGQFRHVGMVAGLLMVIMGMGLYVILGAPGLPASPGSRLQILDIPIEQNGPSFGEAIATIEARIADKPDDIEAYMMLANTARMVSDPSLLARTYHKLTELAPENEQWWVQLAYSYMALGGQKITPAMRLVIADFRERFPGHPVAEFFTAKAHDLDGDSDKAVEVLLALVEKSKPSDPWMGDVRAELIRLGAPGYEAAKTRQLNATELQMASINQMVNSLARRLEANPKDVEGWLRLAKSRQVLGDLDAARKALMTALEHNPEAEAEIKSALDRLTQ